MAFSNKLRAILTITGIAVMSAILVVMLYFISGNISESKRTNLIKENMILCSNLTQSQVDEIDSIYDNIRVFKFGDSISQKMDFSEDKKIQLSFIGLNSDKYHNIIDPINSAIYEFRLIKGRNFNKAECEGFYKSIIVDEVSYTFLFENNYIDGDILKYVYNNQENKFQIIGIVASNYSQIERYNAFMNGFSKAFYVSIYYPKNKITNLNYSLLESNASILGLTEALRIKYDNATFYDYNSYYENFERIKAKSFHDNIGVILGVIICSFFAISLFMFFSLKERGSEIGVRKALGASNSEIFFEFIFEYGILGGIGVLLGEILGVFIFLLSKYFAFINTPFFVFEFSYIPAIATSLLSMLVVLICSTLPGIIFSRIKVVDALRFE